MGLFSISTANPIKFVPELEYNPSLYQTKQFDDYLQIEQGFIPKKYSQKFTFLDRPIIQILSDYTGIVAELRRCSDNSIKAMPVVNTVTTMITGQTFSCYEVAFDFNEENDYYIVLRYTDENSVVISWFSEPLNIKSVHPGTLRFEYKNSLNDFSIIFNGSPDPWIGIFRVEGSILDFKPSSVDTIYDDEIHDTTIINSVPFRQFSLVIGSTSNGSAFGGCPDYIHDKVNRIMSCDQILIDGQYFCKSDGAQWEELRTEGDQFSQQKISITESENHFQLSYDLSNIGELMIPIQKELQFLNVNSGITINNIFKQFIRLEAICVFNPTGTPFDLTIATTTSIDEDDFSKTIPVNGLAKDIEVVRLFSVDKILTLNGFDGINLNIFVLYKKLNAPISGTTNPYTSLGIGAIVSYYEQSPGDFAADFDVLTGKGQDETAWAGWAVCDGNNSTPDLRSRFIRGNDGLTNQGSDPAGALAGSSSRALLIENIPPHMHKLYGAHAAGTPAPFPPYFPIDVNDIAAAEGQGLSSDDFYRISKSPNAQATIGNSGNIGGDPITGLVVPVDVTPAYASLIQVMKIQDV